MSKGIVPGMSIVMRMNSAVSRRRTNTNTNKIIKIIIIVILIKTTYNTTTRMIMMMMILCHFCIKKRLNMSQLRIILRVTDVKGRDVNFLNQQLDLQILCKIMNPA